MTEHKVQLPASQPLTTLVMVLAGTLIFGLSPGQAQPNFNALTDKDFGEIIALDPASGKALNEIPFDIDFYFSLPKGDKELSGVEYELIQREHNDPNCELLLSSGTGNVKMAGPATLIGSNYLLQMPPLSPNQRYCLGINTLRAVTAEEKQKPEFMAALHLATGAAADEIGIPVPPRADPALVTKVNRAIEALDLPFKFRISATDLQAVLDQARAKLTQLASAMTAAAVEMQDEHRLIRLAMESGTSTTPCLSEYCKQRVRQGLVNPEVREEQLRKSIQLEGYAKKMVQYGQWIVRQIANGEPVGPPPEPPVNAGARPLPEPPAQCDEDDVPCKKLEDLRTRLEEALAAKAQVEDRLSIPQLSTVAGLTVRRNQFLAFDVGYGAAPDIDETFYYAAIGIYLRPINKNAPLNPHLVGDEGWFSWSQALRRLSFTLGITETISASSEAPRLKGVVDSGKRPLLLGLSCRVTEALNIGAGGLLFKAVSPNPLDPHEDFRVTPYVSLSLNGNLRELFSGLAKTFSGG